ncbi:putative acetyltransferase [Nocardia nova SH22a]|uniref:Putative acetyltransferase n=1 Tax=Nocardia nova SH22a TaxID=1415166 RepID=W5TLS0_9NOCA|nr:GNAT family N-acetyltransferase [Nocardia nova]AHH19878.1 putative acetyltransferase [Nocardia nova SH22a]
MIEYTWCRRLGEQDRAQALELIRTAARYDEEAGFSTVPEQAVAAASDTGRSVWHLPIKARRDLSVRPDAPMVMVAYLNLTIDERGQGTIGYTVHPDYRSRGVTTLLVEELGLDVGAAGGWCDRGAASLRCWAYGSHPASERLTRRFGIAPSARLWTMARHLAGPFAMPLSPTEFPAGLTVTGPVALAADAVVAAAGDILARQGLTEARFDRFRTEFAERAGAVVLAAAGSERPAGMVWFDPRPIRHLELRGAWVRALIVVPEIRGGGLGEALLTRALDELRSAGTQVALMRIDPDDRAAVRLTRLLSFEQEDAHACYQIGDWEDVPAFAVR